MESRVAGKGRTGITRSLLLPRQEVGHGNRGAGQQVCSKSGGATPHTVLTKLRSTLPQGVTDSASYHGFNRPLEK